MSAVPKQECIRESTTQVHTVVQQLYFKWMTSQSCTPVQDNCKVNIIVATNSSLTQLVTPAVHEWFIMLFMPNTFLYYVQFCDVILLRNATAIATTATLPDTLLTKASAYGAGGHYIQLTTGMVVT